MPRVANANKLNGTFLGFLFPMTLFELPPPWDLGGSVRGLYSCGFIFFLRAQSWAGREDLGRVGDGESMIRIHCVEKSSQKIN